MMTELKPCPFCGNRKIGIYDTCSSKFTKSYKTVECQQCGAIMFDSDEKHSLNDVIEAWNRRVCDETKRSD